MAKPKSDMNKTSAELNAEIEAMRKAIDEKKKLASAARKKEQAEEARAKAIKEAAFNKAFAEKAKEIRWGDFVDDGRTVYETIKYLIDHPEQKTEPSQEIQEASQVDQPMLDDRTRNLLAGAMGTGQNWQ